MPSAAIGILDTGTQGIAAVARLVRRGEFVGPGEETTARYFERELPEGWVVICGKELPRERSAREVDFIAVGDHGIFVIEEKHWSGLVRGNEDGWVLSSGESDRSPLRKLEDIAKRLAQKLKRDLPELGEQRQLDRSAFGMLVIMSHPTVKWEISDPRAHTQVIRLQGCEEELLRLDAHYAIAGSFAPYRSDILRVLEQLPDQPEIPARVGSYSVIERISQLGDVLSLRARHDDGNERILKLVRRPTTGDPELWRERERALIREYDALSRLASTGCVPSVDPYFLWDQDQFWVLPLHVLTGRSLRGDVVERTTIDDSKALGITTAAFATLATVHASGVVHRAITPDRVVIQDTGKVALTDLLVARLEGAQTVAGEMDAMDPDNTWRAPECVANPSGATPESDVWSLASCLKFWLSGQDHRESDEPMSGETLRELAPELGSEVVDVLGRLLARCLANDRDRRPSAAEMSSALAGALPHEEPARRPGELREEELVDDRYRVERRLGSGATADTYLVTDNLVEGYVVLKVIRDQTVAQRLVRSEWKLAHLIHPALPRIYDVNPPEAAFQVKLEYVRGSTLREVRDEFRFRPDACRQIGEQILGALSYLADRGLIHRDVSASNILVPDEHRGIAKLIDFGLAVAREGAESMVGTPRYRAPEIDRGERWTPSCDLYSLGVVLFEALTGRLPYEAADRSSYKDRLITPTEEEIDRAGSRLLEVLLKSVSPAPEDRYPDAATFAAALQSSSQEVERAPAGEELVNGTVQSLRGLYRNSRAGNADNRGLDSHFAQTTYVETLLDTDLAPAIMAGQYRLVILSGNPGDGKTAFLQRLLARVREDGASIERDDASGWKADLRGTSISALYDASESHEGLSADELVGRTLMPLSGNEPDAAAYTAVVAVNDGRLIDFFERLGNEQYPWLWERVRGQLFGDGVAADVAVVDLKVRSPAAGVPLLMDRVLLELVAAERWGVCEGCVARLECPIRFNALSFSDPGVGSVVRFRLAELSRGVHFRREQRPTFRDLRSALAFAITHDLGCEDVHAERREGVNPSAQSSRLYFNALVDGSGTPDLLLGEWGALDPALSPSPRLDRYLHFHRHGPGSAALESLLEPAVERPSIALRGNLDDEQWLRVMKRRYYFEARSAEDEFPRAQDLLPYRHLSSFEAAVLEESDDDALMTLMLEGLGRADGVPEIAAEAGLAMRVNPGASAEVVVIKRLPKDDFRLRRPRLNTRFVEGLTDHLIVEHVDGTPRLVVTLELFELIMRAQEGYVAGAEEQRALYEDLATFKDELLVRPAGEALLLEAGRRFHRVYIDHGTIVQESIEG